ncbi:MAG: alpha-1,2-fucosyltransferase [Dehalococcoidia bacterium]|jgi:hypothetical protein
MISFKNLGNFGNLGNQLFQYAFLRTAARRLGVKFYCPRWIGDDIFTLNDSEERAENLENISSQYVEPNNYLGFNPSTLRIEDGTDILGYFQTQQYWDPQSIREWYTFRQDRIDRVSIKYKDIDFYRSVGMHLRFGDKRSSIDCRVLFYNPRPQYYKRALSCIKPEKNVIVFSDEIGVAKDYLQPVKNNFIFVDGNEPYEDLFLMTWCCDLILSASTFCWWGALLNSHCGNIIAPSEGALRPGYWVKNYDYICESWIKIKALRWFVDDYYITLLKELFRHPRETMPVISRKISWALSFCKSFLIARKGKVRIK